MFSVKKFFQDWGIIGVIIVGLILYGLYHLMCYLRKKGMFGAETAQTMPLQYGGSSDNVSSGMITSSVVEPSDGLDLTDTYAPVQPGTKTTIPMMPSTCSPPVITNPSELLPKDNNNQWAELNPVGKGELANINLLTAGYKIGIDTIGSSLRNANQQIRSEPPNPQSFVSIWNQPTITPDYMRVPLEIGSGIQ